MRAQHLCCAELNCGSAARVSYFASMTSQRLCCEEPKPSLSNNATSRRFNEGSVSAAKNPCPLCQITRPLPVIASAAKQSSAVRKNWIASAQARLAMTGQRGNSAAGFNEGAASLLRRTRLLLQGSWRVDSCASSWRRSATSRCGACSARPACSATPSWEVFSISSRPADRGFFAFRPCWHRCPGKHRSFRRRSARP